MPRIANVFDSPTFAARYEEWYAGPGRRADRAEKVLLGKLLSDFPDLRTVLEVGCGTGHFTRWLAARGLSIFGLDLSLCMLAGARRFGGTLYMRGDALALPFSDRAFDLVLLITTLEFVADPALAIAEAVRVARQGILIGVLNRYSLLAVWCRVSRDPVWQSARFLSVSEVAYLVRQAAGPRMLTLRWRTILGPVPGLVDLAWPWGGFIGLAARLRVK